MVHDPLFPFGYNQYLNINFLQDEKEVIVVFFAKKDTLRCPVVKWDCKLCTSDRILLR